MVKARHMRAAEGRCHTKNDMMEVFIVWDAGK